LEALENLENVKIVGADLDLTEKAYPKIKHLDARFNDNFSSEQFLKQFPNLEFLKFDRSRFELTESFFITLLSGLKRLKTLEMEIWSDPELDPKSILQCFEKYGKHLEEAKIRFMHRSLTIKKIPGSSFFIDDDLFENLYWPEVFGF
jgi:hypothetical protein